MTDKSPVSHPKPLAFCKFYFGPSTLCKADAHCRFSHDNEAYMEKYKVMPCPNVGCYCFCSATSKQCKKCHMDYVKKLAAQKATFLAVKAAAAEARERPLEHGVSPLIPLTPVKKPSMKKCQGHNCTEMTARKFCIACFNVNRTYVISR